MTQKSADYVSRQISIAEMDISERLTQLEAAISLPVTGLFLCSIDITNVGDVEQRTLKYVRIQVERLGQFGVNSK